MLRAILVDDEKHALNLLSKVISERNDMQVVGAYSEISQLLSSVTELKPDVIFLDIEMPEMNGLQLGEQLRRLGLEFEIVFVTAYRQYALDAFDVEAIDYLLKPINPEMLQRTIERIEKRRAASVKTVVEAPPAVSIHCFGGFSIQKPDHAEPIRFPTAKAEELFAYLLMNRNSNISKWTLCDSLWPEQAGSKNSENNLHTTVYRMKKVLRDNGIEVKLYSQRGVYRMECDIHCDYISFAENLEELVKASDGQLELLLEKTQLYKGVLFSGMDYHWCEAERERMSRYYSVLAKKLAAYYIQNGQHIRAIDILLSLLSHEPYDSEAYEKLLRTFIEVNDKASFMTHYEKMERVFLEELGIEPSHGLKALYQSVK